MSPRSKILASSMTVVALAAAGISGYLTWDSWQVHSTAGCTAAGLFDCDTVLASQWSTWLGVPVAALGAAVYLAMALVVWPAAMRPPALAMWSLLALALAAVGAGVWFVGLQVLQLQSYCIFCLSVHLCGLTLAVLAFLLLGEVRSDDPCTAVQTSLGLSGKAIPSLVQHRAADFGPGRVAAAAGTAACGLVVLIIGQAMFGSPPGSQLKEVAVAPVEEQPSAEAGPSDAELAQGSRAYRDDASDPLSFMDNRRRDPVRRPAAQAGRLMSFEALPEPLDVETMPLLGEPDARYVVVEMLDYTCSHCRHLHPRIQAARERYGDDLAVVVYHVPLSSQCNDHLPQGKRGRAGACQYAALALAVWREQPEQFAEYHDWLMQSAYPPSIEAARRQALAVAGGKVLLDDRRNAETVGRLRRQCDDWSRLQTGLPLLLFRTGAVRGSATSDGEFFDLLERKLGIEPLAQVPN